MFLRVTTLLPTAVRAGAVNYALRAYKVFVESVVVKTIEEAHRIVNMKF